MIQRPEVACKEEHFEPCAAMGRYALRCLSSDSCRVVDSSRDSFTVVPFALVSSRD